MSQRATKIQRLYEDESMFLSQVTELKVPAPVPWACSTTCKDLTLFCLTKSAVGAYLYSSSGQSEQRCWCRQVKVLV